MALLRPGSPRLGILAAMFVFVLAGCGDDTSRTGGDTAGEDPSASSEPTSSATTEPSEPASAETSEAATEPPAAGLEARLLGADELAGVNDETVWKVGATGPEDGVTVGECQRFDFVSLGASEAVVRTFTSNQDSVEASQVVGEFADAKSAWRAHQVLKKWRATCAGQVDAAEVKVEDLRALPTDTGHADAYVVHYGAADADEQTWAGVGISRRGPVLSLVHVTLVGQDYNYSAGEEPAARSALSALARLG